VGSLPVREDTDEAHALVADLFIIVGLIGLFASTIIVSPGSTTLHYFLHTPAPPHSCYTILQYHASYSVPHPTLTHNTQTTVLV
jgi:hypothetical protein